MDKLSEDHDDSDCAMRKIFNELDADHNGELTGAEVVVGVEKYLGKKLTNHQYEAGKAIFLANAGQDG